MMKAIKVVGDELQWEPAEAPAELPEGHVRIDVAWTAINRADLMQRAGAYPPPPGASDILGLEVSGTVAAVILESTWFKSASSLAFPSMRPNSVKASSCSFMIARMLSRRSCALAEQQIVADYHKS